MKVIVTGGAGFVGSHVVDAYIGTGHDVLVIDDLSTGREENLNPQADFVRLDIRDQEGVASIFERFRPQLVNHHAAQIDIRRSVADPVFDAEVNVVGTLNLLRQAVSFEVEGFLFASSGGAIYGETPQPVGEGAVKAPISPYGAAKVAAEEYLFAYMRTFGLETLALRYGNVYGPRQDPAGEAGVISIFAEAILSEKWPTIFGTGEQVRDYVSVEDVARANLLVTDHLLSGLPAPRDPNERAVNIGTGQSTSVNELFLKLAGVIGFREDAVHAEPRPGELMESRLDVSRAREEFGFVAAVSLEEGLKKVVAWLQGR